MVETKKIAHQKLSGVYCITCSKNNKVYVGSSIDINDRWSRHKRLLRDGKHHNIHMQRAWDLYGRDCFVFSILEVEVKRKRVIEAEQRWITLFNSCDQENGFNIAKTAGSRLGTKHSAETKQKISASGKGRKVPVDVIEKRKQTLKDRDIKPSQACREAAIKSRKGVRPSQHLIDAFVLSIKGKKQSAEHVEKRMARMRKKYILVSPNNEQLTVDNLPLFCKEHNLDSAKLCLVAQGKRNHHKQWKCQYD